MGARNLWRETDMKKDNGAKLTPDSTHRSQSVPASSSPYTPHNWRAGSWCHYVHRRDEKSDISSRLPRTAWKRHKWRLNSGLSGPKPMTASWQAPSMGEGAAAGRDNSPPGKDPPKAKMHLLSLILLLAAMPPRVAPPGLSARLTGTHPLSALLGASPLWGTHIRS